MRALSKQFFGDEALPPSPNAEIHIATGCFMGYGLFDQAVVSLAEARSRFEACI